MSDATSDDAIDAAGLLADPVRRRLYDHVAEAGETGRAEAAEALYSAAREEGARRAPAGDAPATPVSRKHPPFRRPGRGSGFGRDSSLP